MMEAPEAQLPSLVSATACHHGVSRRLRSGEQSKAIRGRRNLVIAFDVPDDPVAHCAGRKCPFLPRGVGGLGWWSSSASAETFPRQKSPFRAMPGRDHIVIPATGRGVFRLSRLGGRCHQYANLG